MTRLLERSHREQMWSLWCQITKDVSHKTQITTGYYKTAPLENMRAPGRATQIGYLGCHIRKPLWYPGSAFDQNKDEPQWCTSNVSSSFFIMRTQRDPLIFFSMKSRHFGSEPQCILKRRRTRFKARLDFLLRHNDAEMLSVPLYRHQSTWVSFWGIWRYSRKQMENIIAEWRTQ